MTITKDFEVLRSPEVIRVMAVPDRLRILGLLRNGPMAAPRLAEETGLSRNRVHYHLRRLVEAGLVHEIEIGKKRRFEERLYQATAAHYMVDPRLGCPDPEASQSILDAMEQSFLDWRRLEVLKIDMGRVADRIITEGLRLQPDETVLLMFAPHGMELAEAMMVRIQAIGARYRTRIWSRSTVFQTLDAHTPESLASLPFIDSADDEKLDAVVHISGSLPQGGPPTPEQMEKLPFLLGSVSSWLRSVHQRGIRFIEFMPPHRGEFEDVADSAEEAIDTFWKCLLVDSTLITEQAQAILGQISTGTEIHIHDDRGTDFHLAVDSDLCHVNDGLISDEDLKAGRTFDSLPAGSLVLLPIGEESQGTFVGDYTSTRGMLFEQPRVSVENGRITSIDAPGNGQALRDALDRNAGDANRLASLRLGLSPIHKCFTGKTMLDGCAAGSITLGFGNNENLGGDLSSTMDLILPSSVASMTITRGDQQTLLIKSGELRLGGNA